MNLLSPCLLAACADNGAPSSHFGGTAMSNYPLRGGKATLWEGGIRATGFLWGRGVPAGANNTELFHCADWMPTFVALAGGSIPASRQLDGYDIWKAITKGAASPRTEILHNIDPGKGTSSKGAVRVGEYKLIIGQGQSGWGANPSPPFNPGGSPDEEEKGPWMFNVRHDPCERHNLIGDDRCAVLPSNITRDYKGLALFSF